MSDSPSPTPVVDRNGTPITVGDYVTMHAPEGVRSGVVVRVDESLANCNGHWVDVQGLLGIEGVPSTILEVMASQPHGDLDANGRSIAQPRDTGAGGGA